MKQGYISRELKSEIEQKNESLERVNLLDKAEKCYDLKQRAIAKNAQINSYRIEHPHEGVPFSVPRNKGKKRIKNGIKNIRNAIEWGRKNFDSENFQESFIREMAFRITPELYEGGIATYRKSGTRITGAMVMPPYPFKVINYEIPNFVKNLKEKLICEKTINRVEAAIYAHFNLTRIHPFVDGNGRVSRALQDVILDHYDIPLPVIESGERMTYYKILDKAIYERKNREGLDIKEISESEKLFYDFVAGKINMSLDKILDACFH